MMPRRALLIHLAAINDLLARGVLHDDFDLKDR